jgi:hypothetical protein
VFLQKEVIGRTELKLQGELESGVEQNCLNIEAQEVLKSLELFSLSHVISAEDTVPLLTTLF